MQATLGKTTMITRRETGSQPAWRRELARAITDPEELLDTLRLDRSLLPGARRAARLFGLRVPRGFVNRMACGDPGDPLLRQVLPIAGELVPSPGFTADPVADTRAEAIPGLLRKYEGRVLLLASGACAVNCRYCFRREFPYGGHTATGARARAALRAIGEDRSVTEVILSGGDPLMMSNSRLGEITSGLAGIPHIARLRIHTRLPIVLPERIDDGIGEWLSSLPWATVVIVHANHPHEIDAQVGGAFRRLRETGVTLLNQSVLLKGVNDDAGTLAALSERLFGFGVLPYYLHMLDKVSGTAHFEVDELHACHIMTALRDRLPGYLVPRLVREVPGAQSKLPVGGCPETAPFEAASQSSPL